jgi:alkanesulfonate monooxygenase SsuD/methylene tetrahydromethanopterin reductase-like flavin-dependent oxidoreductase (luciferase family)
MSTLEIVLIALAAVILLVFLGGVLGARRRDRHRAGRFEEHVRRADRALQQARASDRGWDKGVMEEACRSALREQRPDFAYDQLHLILVDDQPGVDEDRAHFMAVGSGGEARIVLARTGDHWGAESVE